MNEAFWIIDQLILQGVTRFCIAPGSRNTPLVIAAAEHPKAETIVHFDERGLGFYALGYGKGARKPAALIITSGTAVGNLLPSVMEAHHSLTPLLLLTADRPSELLHSGNNQTCDQTKIFSSFVRFQADLPPTLTENYFRSITAQAYFHATQNPSGPVQLNCQFREPLKPLTPQPPRSPIFMPPSRTSSAPFSTTSSRGAILIGRIPTDPTPILNLARRLNWPVFADILSNARLTPTHEQIRHFDWIAKTSPELKPDFLLHFGDRLTSKKILDWPATLHVSPSPFLQDPTRTLTSRIQSDIEPFCDTFQAPPNPTFLAAWKERDATITQQLHDLFQAPSPFTEAHAMQTLTSLLPATTAVFLANGMPIRDADHFLFPPCLGFYANRGLSGIDGNIATAAGLSDGLNTPVLAFLGDQTCLHDLNSLPLLKKTRHPITLIASNNFGGGIFHHLPIATWPHFETFTAASHSWTFEGAARMFDLPYHPFERLSFQTSSLVELFTNREENHRFQKNLLQALQQIPSVYNSN